MMMQRARRRSISEINVVPYIDVSLVLLIIFMITAPLLQTGVEVDLPRAEAKPLDQDQEPPLVVTIDASGHFFLDVGAGRSEPVAPEELALKVVATLRHKPGTAVLLRGDAAVEYGKVVSVMAALKRAGVPSVGLMTEPEES